MVRDTERGLGTVWESNCMVDNFFVLLIEK